MSLDVDKYEADDVIDMLAHHILVYQEPISAGAKLHDKYRDVLR